MLKKKVIMLGNEAIARGAYEAGVKVSAAYPGTPSTEISEYLVQYKDDLYCEWSPQEKVATEVAIGASVAGVPCDVLYEACRVQCGCRSGLYRVLHGCKWRAGDCCGG